jgi:hypothetical protein
LAEREGFIPLPKVHELQRFSDIPEYPYLRKYPPNASQEISFFDRSNGCFFSTAKHAPPVLLAAINVRAWLPFSA